MQQQIQNLYDRRPAAYTVEDRTVFSQFVAALESGMVRACEKHDGKWKVNSWVKMGILVGFRMGVLSEQAWSDRKMFFDKDTIPERQFTLSQQIRIVPGGSSARVGCYIAPGVAIMPPSFINIGAWVDSGTLVDSHALVGSCAQIGRNVHLSAGAMIGGVLEPVGSRPVIIGNDVFIGGNTGVYEGVIIEDSAVIASGTIITASTTVFDAVHNTYLERDPEGSYTIPQGAVVVPGSRPVKGHPGFQVACPIIIKYRDAKTDNAVKLEMDLRDTLE